METELLKSLAKPLERADAWLETQVLTVGTGVQVGLAILIALFAFAAHRVLYPRAEAYLHDLQAPSPVRRLLQAGAGLIGIGVFLLAALVTAGLLRDNLPTLGTRFLTICISLGVAWAIIRLSASLIAHRSLSRVIAGFAWIAAALAIVGLLEPLIRTLDSVGLSVGKARITLWSIVTGLALMTVLIWGAFFVAALISQRLQGSATISPRTQVLLVKLTRGTLIVVAAAVALSTIGIDFAALAVFAGALGVGIGIGLQHQISNLLSGLFLLLDKSIKPGDVIEIGGTYGWVKEMNARYVGLVTRDNKTFLIPNDMFVLDKVINWSHSERLVRLEVKFAVGYEADPHKVRELAAAAGRAPRRIALQPAPLCHMLGFGEGTLDFVLRFWISDPENGVINVKGEVLLALWDSLKEHGIRVPLPQRFVVMGEGKTLPSAAKPT